jgi:hypothetical protein
MKRIINMVLSKIEFYFLYMDIHVKMEWLKYLVIENDGKGILVNYLKHGSRYAKYPN